MESRALAWVRDWQSKNISITCPKCGKEDFTVPRTPGDHELECTKSWIFFRFTIHVRDEDERSWRRDGKDYDVW